jgi:hypothetical protein
MLKKSCCLLLLGLLTGCHAVPAMTATTLKLKGTDLKNAQFSAEDEQGRKLNFQIRDVSLDPQDAEQETYLYTVFVQDPQDAQWKNLCEPDYHHVAKAIPLQGSWDAQGNYHPSQTVTFGCTSGAIGKCVRMGYKPWKTVNGQSLQDLHQACIRMVRADYCGDGRGHTRNGTPIDVYDRLGIQKPTPQNGMVLEAAWTPTGAAFVNHSRWYDQPTALLQECPQKLQGQVNTSQQFLSREKVEQTHPEALLFNDSLLRQK